MFLVHFVYIFANNITRVSRTRAYNAARYETSHLTWCYFPSGAAQEGNHKSATIQLQDIHCETHDLPESVCPNPTPALERFWVTDSPAEKPSVCFGPAKSQDVIWRGWSIKRLTSSLNRLFFVWPSIYLEARATIHYHTTLYSLMAR